MNVSMHLHDCKTNEKRCASASMIAEYERRNRLRLMISTTEVTSRSDVTTINYCARID